MAPPFHESTTSFPERMDPFHESTAPFHEMMVPFHEGMASFPEMVASFHESAAPFHEMVALFPEMAAPFREMAVPFLELAARSLDARAMALHACNSSHQSVIAPATGRTGDITDTGENSMSDHHILHAAEKLVHALNKTVDENLPKEIADIVKNHSAGAAAAGIAAGWVPGAGGVAATAICVGFIWTMYGRINSKIGLPLADNVVKSLASGAATNTAAYVIGGIVLQTVFSIFPGIGSVAASAVAGVTCYALTLASGYVYLKLLTKLFLDGRDPTKMDEATLKDTANRIMSTEDVKQVIRDAKADYKSPQN